MSELMSTNILLTCIPMTFVARVSIYTHQAAILNRAARPLCKHATGHDPGPLTMRVQRTLMLVSISVAVAALLKSSARRLWPSAADEL